ncbi:carbohydrate ABC transporter permease [Paenibacillus eucommiae]|uniref:ABC-type sugar transport system permease subunit n=1 Tax=Paenibacillus eucommiae TaxID=1355755 RepID=A0ABS4J0D6_9BACL|nr:sugar ABC transporter permease [Paenibacillus eucommiae]MBP1993302.1 ABC-type sugar transport system permease subunit [Paenibacillus eucommiae]
MPKEAIELKSTRVKTKVWRQQESVQRMWFIMIAVGPCLLGYLLFTLYPNLMSVWYAFLNWDGLSPAKFVGLDNFKHMFQDPFIGRAIYHNILLMIFAPGVTILFSLVIAYLLVNKGYKEAAIYKILFFVPNVLAIVVVTLLWAFIYDGSYGLLNGLLKTIGIDNQNFYWLGDKKTALWSLIPPMVWSGVGLYVIIFMNAMRSIPSSLYETAIIEGANHSVRLFKITLPLIMPIVRVSIIFLTLGVLKGFEMVLIMTNGGPAGSTDVIGLYIFKLAFGDSYRSYGYASAIGLVLFVVLVFAKLIIDKFVPSEGNEY